MKKLQLLIVLSVITLSNVYGQDFNHFWKIDSIVASYRDIENSDKYLNISEGRKLDISKNPLFDQMIAYYEPTKNYPITIMYGKGDGVNKETEYIAYFYYFNGELVFVHQNIKGEEIKTYYKGGQAYRPDYHHTEFKKVQDNSILKQSKDFLNWFTTRSKN